MRAFLDTHIGTVGGRDVRANYEVDELTLAQHGLITTEQAIKALGPSRKSRWVTERRLISVQPSVFRMAGAPETWHQGLMAASLAVDGVVSHRSAAELWGLIQPAGYVEVSIRGTTSDTVRRPRSSIGSRTFAQACRWSAKA